MALRPRLSEGQPCLLGYAISISFLIFLFFWSEHRWEEDNPGVSLFALEFEDLDLVLGLIILPFSF